MKRLSICLLGAGLVTIALLATIYGTKEGEVVDRAARSTRLSMPAAAPRGTSSAADTPSNHSRIRIAQRAQEAVRRADAEEVAIGVQILALEALGDPKRFPELTRCRSEGRACNEETLAALGVALDYPLRPSIGRGNFGLRELEAKLGRRKFSLAVHENAVRTLTSSADPIDRVAALALLERANGDVPPMPTEVTEKLGELPALEQRLLLDELANEPVNSEQTTKEIAALASSGDATIQTKAIRALGAARAPDALAQALSSADAHEPIDRSMALEHVAPALRECGSACSGVMVDLAETGSPMLQVAALSAIVSMDAGQRSRLARDVIERLDRARVAPPVKRQLDHLIRLIET